ncbi:hypothetical protein AVHM3334_19805 [Acidovorax sp. SUPP3334]|nr:hypothetical protein AVHM3334_19805 [Acidovorax sp. SUPP3334]
MDTATRLQPDAPAPLALRFAAAASGAAALMT